MFALRPGAIWRFLLTQPLSFWLICIYMFFEYVRPQQIYAAISGMPFASWTIYLAGAAFLLEGARGRSWTVADSTLAFFSVVVILSSLTAFRPSVSIGEWQLYFSWVLIYFLITVTVTTEKRFFVFMLAYMLYCFKMSQHGFRSWAEGGFAFRGWGTTCSPGWFQNSGECGIQMSIFFPLAVFFIIGLRPYWSRRTFWLMLALPITAAVTMVGSSSRGALIGLAATVLWMLAKSRNRIQALVVAVVFAGGIYFLIPAEQRLRLQAMGEDETSQSRLVYWERALEMMGDYPLLGIGYKNWLPYHRTHYPVGAFGNQLVHNMFLEAGAELGYIGLGAFLAMIAATFALNRDTRKRAARLPDGGRFLWHMAHGLDGALVGLMASGFFVTVLYYPFFWINLAMTVALHTATRAEERRLRVATRATAVARGGAGGSPVVLWRPRHGT